MARLLVATKNSHKTAEVQAILGSSWEVTDLTAHALVPAPEETGLTFEENAILKARAATRRFPGLVLADDSGLEVDALAGAPGVYSARYAGPTATDADNRAKLVRALASVPAPRRTARFRCVIALAEHHKILGTFHGVVEGSLRLDEQGAGGFGYDSLFIPAGYQQTFAQLPNAVKNRESHRARALHQLLAYLESHPI